MLSPFVILCFIIPYGVAQLTQTEKNDIVDVHNSFRRSVKPGAANMKMMEWSDCLAQVAEDFLSKCSGFKHNYHRTSEAKALGCEASAYVGENLFLTSASSLTDVTQPVTAWNNEDRYYDIYWKSCSNVCGHYTQVVWENSYLVGCAKVSCTVGRKGTYFLCNYAPGGNYFGQAPYKIGTSCSECDQGFNVCNDGLCAANPAIDIM